MGLSPEEINNVSEEIVRELNNNAGYAVFHEDTAPAVINHIISEALIKDRAVIAGELQSLINELNSMVKKKDVTP